MQVLHTHSGSRLAIPSPHMVDLEDDWHNAKTNQARHLIVRFSFLLCSSFFCGLKGEEIMKADISAFPKHLNAGTENPNHPHTLIGLLGHLKGETGVWHHLLPMTVGEQVWHQILFERPRGPKTGSCPPGLQSSQTAHIQCRPPGF